MTIHLFHGSCMPTLKQGQKLWVDWNHENALGFVAKSRHKLSLEVYVTPAKRLGFSLT